MMTDFHLWVTCSFNLCFSSINRPLKLQENCTIHYIYRSVVLMNDKQDLNEHFCDDVFPCSGLLTTIITSWYVTMIVENFHASHHLQRYRHTHTHTNTHTHVYTLDNVSSRFCIYMNLNVCVFSAVLSLVRRCSSAGRAASSPWLAVLSSPVGDADSPDRASR